MAKTLPDRDVGRLNREYEAVKSPRSSRVWRKKLPGGTLLFFWSTGNHDN